MSQIETQYTISEWATATFGESGSNVRAAIRANEEMAELLKHLSEGDESKAAEEIADILIVLFRVGTRLGIDVLNAVDEKMKINRSRTWKLDGTGHGYHA